MNYMKCVFQRESVGQWEYRQLFYGSIMVSMPAYPLEHVTDIDYMSWDHIIGNALHVNCIKTTCHGQNGHIL